jgi:Beta-propeller repeat
MVNCGQVAAVLKRGRGTAPLVFLVLGGIVLFKQDSARQFRLTPASNPVVATSVVARFPLSFEPNVGQTAAPVKFLAHGSDYGLYLTSSEAVLALSGRTPSGLKESFIRMRFANSQATAEAAQLLPGRTNYFIGNDPSRWKRNVPQYARVQYRDVYPGVDLAFYGNQGRLEYDFDVRPGADPRQIELNFEGAEKVEIAENGDLVVAGTDREVRFEEPRVFQETSAGVRHVDGTFVLLAGNRVGFKVGDYDRSRDLIIDPVLAYSTYLGGSGAESCAAIAGAQFVPHCPAITVDSASRVYIAGATASPGPSFPGAGSSVTLNGSADVFVARISNSGSALAVDYVTYLGGSGIEYPTGIGVDSGFNVYVAGNTSSSDFPTANGLQSSASGNHGFLTKLDSSGSVNLYSTYLSGSGTESISAMTLDSQARVYVFGTTTSPDFPTTPGALQSAANATNQFFFAKLNPAQNGNNSLLYSTFIGGSNPSNGVVVGGAIAVDSNFNVYLAGGTNFTDMPVVNAFEGILQGGTNVWAARLIAATNNTQQYTLSYETYFGAPNDNTQVDIAHGVATDGTSMYITGSTTATGFTPVTGTTAFQSANAGGTDAFIARFGVPTTIGTTQGTVPLNYFTYIGGSSTDVGVALVVDSAQNARLTGFTQSSDFPNSNPLTGSPGGGPADAFYARIATSLGSSSSSTSSTSILGGSGTDLGTSIATDVSLDSYVAGETASGNFPTAASPGQPVIAPVEATLSGPSDAFISKLGASTTGLDFACPAIATTCPPSNPTVNPSPVGAGSNVTFIYSIYNTSDPVTGVIFTDNANQVANASANSSIVSAIPSSGSCTSNGATAVCNLGTVNSSTIVTSGSTTTVSAPVTVTVTVAATPPPPSGPTPAQPPNIGNTGLLTIAGTNFQRTASQTSVVNDFGVQATPNTQTVTAGNQATYTITVTPSGPIPESVSLGQCSGLPSGANCVFSNNPIANLNTGAQNRTLDITTTARVTTPASLFHPGGPLYAFWFPVSGLALIGAGTARKRRWLVGAFVLCTLMVMALQVGCSSSSGNASTTTGTPAGTYTVTLNATSGSATRSTAVTLIVQ